MKQSNIIHYLKKVKPLYEKEGLIILGLFGSFAKNSETQYSDIDIAYKIDYALFSKKYVDGFSKLLRINDIKDEMKKNLQRPIDLIPFKESIMKELIYV